MDYEEARQELGNLTLGGALGVVRDVLLFLLTEIEQLVDLVDELRGDDDDTSRRGEV